jgi:drug/metabolite transporter (DMT)-like permease
VYLALVLRLSDIKALTPVALGWIALMGALAYPFARVLVSTAISMIGAARTSPVNSLQPIFVLGLAMAILGERPSLLVGVGTPMVVCGLVVVILLGGINESSSHALDTRKLGYLLALGGATTFAIRDVISRHVVTGIAPPLVTAAFALAIGGSILFIFTHRDVVSSLRRVPPRYIVICGLAGVCQGLAVVALFQALSRAPVTVVSPISAGSPLITLALSHIFLRRLESINVFLVLGTLLSVAGVVTVVLGAAPD